MIVSVSKEIDDSKIRMERARLHISQKELAQRIGTTREKINAIENAKCKKVQIELLEKLANVFELKVEDLLKNIYDSGELNEDSTYSILEYMGNDGKQRYQTKFYNLDVILSVGYRVNSKNATQFRI